MSAKTVQEPLQAIPPRPNPFNLGPADLRVRVHNPADADFAVMTIVGFLADRGWTIRRYDCDIEQSYCHVSARFVELTRVDTKNLAGEVRAQLTDEDDHPIMVVMETARGICVANPQHPGGHITEVS